MIEPKSTKEIFKKQNLTHFSLKKNSSLPKLLEYPSSNSNSPLKGSSNTMKMPSTKFQMKDHIKKVIGIYQTPAQSLQDWCKITLRNSTSQMSRSRYNNSRAKSISNQLNVVKT